MSYIDIAISHVATDRSRGHDITTTVGFSREGGRLEQVRQEWRRAGAEDVRTFTFTPSVDMERPARALLDAVLGAGGVRSITVAHDTPGAATVTWADRYGAPLGSAPSNEVPAAIRQVLDASRSLAATLPAPTA
jgi:hypothetical protein